MDAQAIEQRITKRKSNIKFRLPSITAVRDARHLIAMETEKKIAEEMLRKECAIMPEGTGRKIIGKVGGAVLQVGGKTRVLPFQMMGNETRENWAKFIDHVLTRMAVLSEIEKKELWGTVLLFISDQCKTNKGLAKEVAQYMGLEHQPGQIFCNIHPVLMFDEKVKKKWQDLQIKIGAEEAKELVVEANTGKVDVAEKQRKKMKWFCNVHGCMVEHRKEAECSCCGDRCEGVAYSDDEDDDQFDPP